MNIEKDDHFFFKVINLGFKKYGLEEALHSQVLSEEQLRDRSGSLPADFDSAKNRGQN